MSVVSSKAALTELLGKWHGDSEVCIDGASKDVVAPTLNIEVDGDGAEDHEHAMNQI